MENPGLAYSYLSFNMKSSHLQEIKLRQALAYAINVPEIIKYRLEGHAMPAHSLLAPVNWFAETEVQTYPYDPEKAQKLLDATGLKDPMAKAPNQGSFWNQKPVTMPK